MSEAEIISEVRRAARLIVECGAINNIETMTLGNACLNIVFSGLINAFEDRTQYEERLKIMFASALAQWDLTKARV